MDIMTVVGFILAIGCMLLGMVFDSATSSVNFDSLGAFVDVPSIIIVVFGTFAALMISFPLKFFVAMPKQIKFVFLPPKFEPLDFINQIVDFATEARINGLLALEGKLNEIEDDFLKSSLLMVVDAVDADKVKTFLEEKISYIDDRHGQAIAFFASAAAIAPAFGMIGTLIGLVILLGNMDDPSALGASMAVALLTTMYGSIMANVFFNPISSKLKARHEEELLCKMIVCEGVQSIQAGDNPKFIHEKLLQLLPASVAASANVDGGD